MAKRHVWCHEMTIKNVNEKEKKIVHGEEKRQETTSSTRHTTQPPQNGIESVRFEPKLEHERMLIESGTCERIQ